MDNEQTDNKPSWKNRRRVIFSSLLFCGFCITYVMIFGTDTRVNESIILGSFALVASIIGSYVFGAVWSDNTERKHAIGSRNNNTYIGGRHTTTIAPSSDRRQKAKERLERMRARKKGIDNPDG